MQFLYLSKHTVRKRAPKRLRTYMKHRLNDRNISTQHFVTLLGATCCTCLITLLWLVARFWVLKIELVHMSGRNMLHEPDQKKYNIMQHSQMLHEKFDYFYIWGNNTQHVAISRNRVAKRAQYTAPNNVAICCLEMLRLFSPGLTW